MNYLEFYDKLNKCRLISPIWKNILLFIDSEINNSNKDNILKIFSIYFSLISDGNLCMKLNDELLIDWNTKLDKAKIQLEENDKIDINIIDELKNESKDIIDSSLNLININSLSSIIGDNKLFIIDDNYLYTRKNFNAKNNIINVIKTLYEKELDNKELPIKIEDYFNKNKNFNLSKGQMDVVKKGINGNLLVTGGPGTGKTTSVLFLLACLLKEDIDYDIYITAPSGKAASRMKESILANLDNSLNKDGFINDYKEIYDKLANLEGTTIHRLLGYKNGGFNYNKDNQFSSKSIFVIDEASMIDALIFSSLLSSIPKDAKIYILGDKDQLPSVECGAVYGDLLKIDKLKDKIVRLTESKRYEENSPIDLLAKDVNSGKIPNIIFENYNEFELLDYVKNQYNIKYYLDNQIIDNNNEKESEKIIISHIVDKWYKRFYLDLKNKCDNINILDNNIIDILNKIYYNVEESKILCAENDSIRGVRKINKYIQNKCYLNNDISINNHHIGEILMINKNDYLLDLNNGDMGIIVKINNDNMLYFMVNKTTNLVDFDGYRMNKIFKISNYVFYPMHMISNEEIDLAYAISIHKSQGSDYANILVILPKKKGHPLLNRQIVYTAITRTKGNTYILSNKDRLEEASNELLTRLTNINF